MDQPKAFGPSDKRLIIPVQHPDGSDSGCSVDLRYTSDRFELYFHSPETCAGGCEPLINLEFMRREVYEAMHQSGGKSYRVGEEFSDFIQGLADIFGGDRVIIADEHGIRPLSKKKQN